MCSFFVVFCKKGANRMRYTIEGDHLPVVICHLAAGEAMFNRKRFHGVDVPQYADGNQCQRRVWQIFRQNIYGRFHVPKHLYCPGRQRHDCLCFRLSRFHSAFYSGSGTRIYLAEKSLSCRRDGRRPIGAFPSEAKVRSCLAERDFYCKRFPATVLFLLSSTVMW